MFDQIRVRANRIKSEQIINESPFYQFICHDLVDRLKPIDKNFNQILLINPILKNNFVTFLEKIYSNSTINFANWDEIDSPLLNWNRKFDLIIFPFGMHWISDVQLLLKRCTTLV